MYMAPADALPGMGMAYHFTGMGLRVHKHAQTDHKCVIDELA